MAPHLDTHTRDIQVPKRGETKKDTGKLRHRSTNSAVSF